MQKIRQNVFIGLYVLILSLELVSGFFPVLLAPLHLIAKPLLMMTLIWYTLARLQGVRSPVKTVFISALLFSLAGDVWLLFQEYNPIYFLLGLSAFLIAHIGYIITFFKIPDAKREINWSSWLIWFGLFDFLVIGGVIFTLIYPNLAAMMWPVVVYILVITTMGFAAITRKGRVSKGSFDLVMLGAMLFVISDGVLALNKFYHPVPMAHVWIMFPYALAQLLIVLGVIRQMQLKIIGS